MKDHRRITKARAKKGAHGRPGYERPGRPRVVHYISRNYCPACEARRAKGSAGTGPA